ncbi:DNA polymerase-3 subunit beta [Catenulispora sp. EB89]|uniref:DNA polymerase III subunit beta n=1 Tax=unclassified Catenulispora TaxID=414885 RepID=UPI003512BE13
MKFRVERDVLSEAVAWTARSLPSRPAAPVLAGLVFEAVEGDGGDSGSVTLSGFDYEVSSRAQISADVTEPGRILIHGKLLADIAKSLPNRPVEFSTEGSKVLVSCGSSRFTLQTLPVEDYPALPTMPTATGAVTASGLAGAVSQVAIAAGRDDTIPMLTGIRVEIEGERVTLVATDRFRLAVRELQWKPEQQDMSATALIPSKVLSDTAKALTGGDWVTLALAGSDAGEGLIGFESGEGASSGAKGSRRMTSRLLSGEFVKYRSLFPNEYNITATVETAPFLEAAKRVSLVADRTSPIKLAFTQGEVTLEAGAGDEAQASEAMDAVLDGEDISVSFNPSFLLDGLQVIDTQYAQLSFTVASKPAVLMGRPALDAPPQEEFRYLMMPLRVPGQSAG